MVNTATTISDFYWVISSAAILITLLVLELRAQGHLKIHREPSKGEACCLLFLVGSPCFGVFIILGLVGLYYAIGEPPLLGVLLMTLYFGDKLFGVIFTSVAFALFLRKMYESWGVVGLASVLVLVLSASYVLSIIGVSSELMDFLTRDVPILIALLFIEYPLQVIFVAFLLRGRPKRTSEREEKAKHPQGLELKGSVSEKSQHTSKEITTSSVRSTFEVIVHLFRKIVDDKDYEALTAVFAVHDNCPEKFQTVAVMLRQPQLRRLLTGNISRDADVLESLIKEKRVSKLSWALRLCIALMYACIYALIWSWDLFPPRTMFVLIIAPVILLFFSSVLMVIPQMIGSDTTELGTVPNSKAYLLTKREFNRRKWLCRVAYLVLSVLFVATVILYSLILHPEMLIHSYVVVLVYLTTAPLAARDRVIRGSSGEVNLKDAVLRLIPKEKDEETNKCEKEKEDKHKTLDIHTFSSPLEPPDFTDILVSDHDFGRNEFAIEDEMLSNHCVSDTLEEEEGITRDVALFIERLKRPRLLLYEEYKAALMAGMACLIAFIGVLLTWLFSTGKLLFVPTEVKLISFGVGIAITAIAIANWYKTTLKYGFRRIGRHVLSLILSTIEIHSKGVEEIGFVISPYMPEEFKGLGMAPKIGYIRIARKTAGEVTWPTDALYDAIKRFQGLTSRVGIFSGVVMTALGVLMWLGMGNLTSDGMFVLVRYTMIGIGFMGVFVIIYSWYARSERSIRWLSRVELSDQTTLSNTFEQLLSLVRRECKHPFRLLVLGDDYELYFTGREFKTTKNIILKEAVLIPLSDLGAEKELRHTGL